MTAAAARTLVEGKDLSRWFEGRKGAPVRAVENVSFAIAEREVLGVVGESGSGKSTLGRLALRLLEPSAGAILFDGQDLAGLDAAGLRRFRRNMQMVFQDPFASLNARMTIGAALEEVIRLHHGVGRREARARAGTLLSQVGLATAFLDRYPRACSGGQRQRIAIARALAPDPRFIVADEPVSALDVSVQAEVLNLLAELKDRLGLTMMFISHDLSVVEIVSDRVMVLYLGRIMEIGPTADVYARPRHPYTAALLSAAPGQGGSRARIVLQGEIPSPSDPPSGCVFRTRCPFAISDCATVVPALDVVAPQHLKACIRDDIDV
jgi:oligopeptide/dipeptide ABC transporter ATP-binding protein